MEHVRWNTDADPSSLVRPVMVAAFGGWNDAGDAATTAIRTLVESTDATPLAEIDPEPFTDFATVRPHVRLDADRHREIVWPTVGVWSVSLPGTDVVVVLGPEPSLRWRLFCDEIGDVAERVGATTVYTLGALLADVPHTRRTQIIATATDTGLMERFDLEPSRYEGPTGIVGVLHDALSRRGLATASLWAAVPGYVPQLPSPRAAHALLDRLCSMMGTPVPGGALVGDFDDYDARVASMISDDDDLVTYVARLEEIVDDDPDDDPSGEIVIDDPTAIADEVEQFLRSRDDD